MGQIEIALKSPPALPFFGHVRAYRRDPIAFYTRCAREYGDWTPLRYGAMHAYLATHPDLIEAVLVTRHRSFRKSPGLRRSAVLFGNGLLTAEGDFWRKQRRLIQPAFHRDRIAAYARTMSERTQAHLTGWENGQTFDLHADLMKLTLEVAVQTLFGTQVREMEAVARAMEVGQQAYVRWMHYLIMLPAWFPTPKMPGIARAISHLDHVVYGMIAERRAHGDDGNDLLSMLLKLEDADDGVGMSERQIRDEILTLFLAGHETTALTLTWTFYLLAQNPAAEERLHAELANVLEGRAPTLEDVERLPYTDQVIRESMRLYPPAWVIGREAVEDVEIGGHRVPAGHSVLMPQYLVHRDPRFFAQPETFLPERWTPEFMRALPKHAYFPFGGGPRICIGSSFAMLESVLLLASIASQFRLTLLPDRPVIPQPAFTLRPLNGIWVEAAQR